VRDRIREVVDWRPTELGTTEARSGASDWVPDDTEPVTSERITLIEFMWMGLRGAQPVILVSREWLQ
jgi:hypothetical protein